MIHVQHKVRSAPMSADHKLLVRLDVPMGILAAAAAALEGSLRGKVKYATNALRMVQLIGTSTYRVWMAFNVAIQKLGPSTSIRCAMFASRSCSIAW
mmetsp:Transcript_151239/g.485812  ORF Transcript_151239/g.485812 Transcript_151239/m.485812 type:complete len:97 (-) Transcript_151239:391-681(-)